MEKVIVPLPLGKNINYKGITNAGWEQQALITLEDGRVIILTGTGEDKVAGAVGSFVTPTDWHKPEFMAEISMNHRPTKNDPWKPSDLEISTVLTGGVNTVTVVSEDGAPGFTPDYNDFVAQLVWFM